jgi:hypothetical protein
MLILRCVELHREYKYCDGVTSRGMLIKFVAPPLRRVIESPFGLSSIIAENITR